MKKIKRQKNILEIIINNEHVDVNDLSRLFLVSKETIRRDLTQLSKIGLVERNYGGASLSSNVLYQENMNKNIDFKGKDRCNSNIIYEVEQEKPKLGIVSESSFSFRKNTETDSKVKIAHKAASFVCRGDTVLLDGGTTTWFLARQLPDIDITVITNSLPILNTLASKDNVKVVCLGGDYLSSEEVFYSKNITDALSEYTINKFFFSCVSISSFYGILDGNELISYIKRKMAIVSQQVFLLCGKKSIKSWLV